MQEDKVTAELFKEYTLNGVRKYYIGSHPAIRGADGYAWLSQTYNRWCFIPLKTRFTTDTVIFVNPANLRNT